MAPDEKAEFARALEGPLYQMVRVRLPVLLLRLDATLGAGGVQYDHKIITVEHVLLQNPAKDSEWLTQFPDPSLTVLSERSFPVNMLRARGVSLAT